MASPFTTLTIQTNCPTPSTIGTYVMTPVTCQTGNSDLWFNFNNFFDMPAAASFPIQALANPANEGFYVPANTAGPLNFEFGFDALFCCAGWTKRRDDHLSPAADRS